MNINHILCKDLISFIIKSFYTISPGTDYKHNWHIELISAVLNNIETGSMNRVIINMPPRYLKSICISVAWPAWLLGHYPSTKIIVVSYSQQLSEKHSQDTRLIMQQAWYKNLFPNTVICSGENQKNKFVTTQRGFRFATSPKGTLTGEGADIIIVDDPHNPAYIHNAKIRRAINRWFDQVLLSRLNDKKTGKIIVTMQRLHYDDLTASLSDKNNWKIFALPILNREQQIFQLGNFHHLREQNTALHSAREGISEINNIKHDLGEYTFQAQYQQAPIKDNNNFIKSNMINYYNDIPRNFECAIQSWDTACKVNHDSDYSVGTTWLSCNNGYYLVDICRRKIEFSDLSNAIIDNYEKWTPKYVLIEDKMSGHSLISFLSQNTKLPIIPITAHKDKLTRLLHVIHLFNTKKIFLPKSAAWLATYKEELFNFPNCHHDDQVDSTTQFLNWTIDNKQNENKYGIRTLY